MNIILIFIIKPTKKIATNTTINYVIIIKCMPPEYDFKQFIKDDYMYVHISESRIMPVVN